jgi:hypothetical protein
MLIWPVLVLLLVLLFYKRDITPPWNPPLPPWNPAQPPQPQPPAPPASAQTSATPPTRPSSGFSGGFVAPPPVDLNDVFRRPRS